MEKPTYSKEDKAQFVKDLKEKSKESVVDIKNKEERDFVVSFFMARPDIECTPANIQFVRENRSKIVDVFDFDALRMTPPPSPPKESAGAEFDPLEITQEIDISEAIDEHTDTSLGAGTRQEINESGTSSVPISTKPETHGNNQKLDAKARERQITPSPMPPLDEKSARPVKPPTGPVQPPPTPGANSVGQEVQMEAPAKAADEPLIPVYTGDFEIKTVSKPEISEELDGVEPAEAPGPKDIFVQLLNENNIPDAFMMWYEKGEALDDVLLENIEENEDLICAFFRLACAKSRMLDDARRLFDKTKDKIDYDHQMFCIYNKFVDEHKKGKEDHTEILAALRSKFSDVFDLSIFAAKEELIKVREDLQAANGQIAGLTSLKNELEAANSELADGNKRVSGQLATTQAALAQSESRQASLKELDREKEQENKTQSMELIGLRQSSESAIILNRELQGLLAAEREISKAALSQKSSLENTLRAEQDRIRRLQDDNADLKGKFTRESETSQGLREELATVKDSASREADELQEKLRLSQQDVDQQKLFVVAEQKVNAELRKKDSDDGQAMLDFGSIQARLEGEQHLRQQLQTDLSRMEYDNGVLSCRLIEAEKSAGKEIERLTEELRKLRERNDELDKTNKRLQGELGNSLAKTEGLSTIQQQYEIERQKAERRQADLDDERRLLDEERGLSEGLRQQLTEALRRPVAQVQAMPAVSIAKPVNNPIENGIYERLMSGDIKEAEQLCKKLGKGVKITELPRYEWSVREGFYNCLIEGNMKDSLKFWKKFSQHIDLTATLKEAYSYCIDEFLTDTAREIYSHFEDKADFSKF